MSCEVTCKGDARIARVRANEPAATLPVSITYTVADFDLLQLRAATALEKGLNTACAMSDDFSNSSSRALILPSTFCICVSLLV